MGLAVLEVLKVAQEAAEVHQVVPGLDVDEEVDVAALPWRRRERPSRRGAPQRSSGSGGGEVSSRRPPNPANVGGDIPGEHFEHTLRVG